MTDQRFEFWLIVLFLVGTLCTLASEIEGQAADHRPALQLARVCRLEADWKLDDCQVPATCAAQAVTANTLYRVR